MKKKIKIICTLGPSSLKKRELRLLKSLKIDIFRINLSHTSLDKVEGTIKYLKKNNIKNICLDTEGAQIRTTKTKKEYFLKKNKYVNIYIHIKLQIIRKFIYIHFLISKHLKLIQKLILVLMV